MKLLLATYVQAPDAVFLMALDHCRPIENLAKVMTKFSFVKEKLKLGFFQESRYGGNDTHCIMSCIFVFFTGRAPCIIYVFSPRQLEIAY